MKNLKKILVACAAVTSLTLAMAASAFAADLAPADITYDAGKLSVSLENVTQKGQLTVIVLDKDTNVLEVEADDILYIDQGDADAEGLFQSMGLKVPAGLEALPAGSYPIKLGGENINDGIYEGTLVISEETPGGRTVTVVWGDINANGTFNTLDAGAIIDSFIGGSKTFGDFTVGEKFSGDLVWGDVNGNGTFNTLDAGAIIDSFIGGSKQFGEYKLGDSYDFTLNVAE